MVDTGVDGFITNTIYFYTAKSEGTNKKIVDENEALRKRIKELEDQVQNKPRSEHGSCSKNKIQKKQNSNVGVPEKEVISASATHGEGKKENVSENAGKNEKVIAINVPPILKEKVSRTMPK